MMNIDIVEAASGGPFRFRHRGRVHVVADPADVSFQIILLALREEHVPGCPEDMPDWKRHLLFQAWAAHYDLPDFQSANRLAYLIDHYRSALVYDLQTVCGVDLGDLWRARRWRTLLDLIDHLPGPSWYNAAVSNDEEHAQMIAESLAAREQEGEKTDAGPPIQTWTPEVAMMAKAVDAIRGVQYAVVASNSSEKGKAPEPPKPEPRPTTPLEKAMKRANHERRKAAHERLASRLLPNRR